MSDQIAHSRLQGFSQAGGRWLGTAEVFDGQGHFLGNAVDRRHVQVATETSASGAPRTRIDLSFVGPFKFSGHYYIEDHRTHRLYQGPANTGYAETLANNLVDANAYWPLTGLTQRFFLMILPGGKRQLSLGLMSRGEHLLYVVVGENQRLAEGASETDLQPLMVNGIHYDLAGDASSGRGEIYLHRPGEWHGSLSTLDGALEEMPATAYSEVVQWGSRGLNVIISGSAFDDQVRSMLIHSNDWQGWSEAGELVGSYSLSGGRALCGTFHHLPQALRVWRREVVMQDGSAKVVLHTWYRGGQRVGVQFGVLQFAPAT